MEPTANPAPTERPLRIAIVADDPLVRSALAMLLSGTPGILIAAQLGPRDDVAGTLDALHPEAVVWDLGSDGKAAGDRVPDLAAVSLPLVALVPDDSAAGDALGNGATGVLLRGVDGKTLSSALEATARGLVVIDRGLKSVLPARERSAPRQNEELTAREIEVLQLLAAGLPNKVIAQRLGISDHTVKFHVNSIMTKLGVQSRTEAVVRAARLGWVIL